MAFAVSLILGPILNSWVGVPGIFWLTALLALGGIAITLFLVPDPKESHFHRDAEPVPAQFGQVLSDLNLLRLDLGIMVLHMTMTALFLSVPLVLRDYLGIDGGSHWMIYLPVLLLSMVLMVPFIVIAERRRKMKQVLLGAVLALVLAQVGLYLWPHSLFGLASMLLLFFVAFNLLEATLPSLVAKVAKPESKGTAMGVYSTSQFVGAFVGGLVGGWVHSGYGLEEVFLFGAAVALLWFLVASGMAQPSYLTSHLLRVGELSPTQAAELQMELRDIKGVGEATVVPEDGVAYLKIDKKEIDMAALDAFSVADG
jgi:predicted MFS family arabinose efflux permease